METMHTHQQIRYDLDIKTRDGGPATVDGVPVWTGSNSEVATITAAADGLSAVVRAVSPGPMSVSVEADADLGAGVRSLVGLAQIEVTVDPSATVIELRAGVPEDQTPVDPDVPLDPANPAGRAANARQGDGRTATPSTGPIPGQPTADRPRSPEEQRSDRRSEKADAANTRTPHSDTVTPPRDQSDRGRRDR